MKTLQDKAGLTAGLGEWTTRRTIKWGGTRLPFELKLMFESLVHGESALCRVIMRVPSCCRS
jgi:hypothetical protein